MPVATTFTAGSVPSDQENIAAKWSIGLAVSFVGVIVLIMIYPRFASCISALLCGTAEPESYDVEKQTARTCPMVQLSKPIPVFDPTAPVRPMLVSFEASKILPYDAFKVPHEMLSQSADIVVPSDTVAPFLVAPSPVTLSDKNTPFKSARYQPAPRKPSPLRQVSNYVVTQSILRKLAAMKPLTLTRKYGKHEESAVVEWYKAHLQRLDISVPAKWKQNRAIRRPSSYMSKGKIRLEEYEGGYRAGIIKATKGLGEVSRKARASGRENVPERPTWF